MLARRYFAADGSASALTRSFTLAPDLMETLMPFLADVMGPGAVAPVEKELVILRVSQLNGCRYCLAAHRPIALEAGVPADHVAAPCGELALDALSAPDRLLVEWVDAVVLDAAGIDDQLVARMLDRFRDDQLVELTVLIGAITMLNQYCTALDIPPPVAAA